MRAAVAGGCVRSFLPWLFATVPPTALVVAHAVVAEETRWWFVARSLYWATAATVALALAASIVRWRAAATTWRGALQWGPGLALACALAAAVFMLVPPVMRVQFDETSLVNTSQTMHRVRATMMVTGAVPFDGEFVALENTIDKRPPLFPFLVSVLHDATGQRIANAFAVNGLLLAAALFLAFAFARRRLGAVAATAAPLLLLALPMTTVCATSAGFDLLAVVLFGVVLLAAHDFVAEPDDARGALFLATGVLFAQSRYESLFAFALLAGLAGFCVRRRWRPGRWTKVALVSVPTLVTPLFFLLQIARNPNFYPEAGGAPLLGGSHFVAHVGPFVGRWFWPLVGNPLPGVVAVVAVVAWAARWVHGRGRTTDLIALLPVLAVTVLALAWFSGDVREPIAWRLYLPAAFGTMLSPLLLVATFGRRVAPWLLAGALALAVVAVLGVRREETFPRLEGERVLGAVEAELARIGDDRRTLWVTTVAQHLVTTGRYALSPMAFVRQQRDVQASLRGDLRAIYLIETPLDRDLAGGFGDPRQLVPPGGAGLVFRTAGELPVAVYRLR